MRLTTLIFCLGYLIFLNSCDRNEPTPVPDCCYDCSCHYPCDDNEYFTYPYTDTLYLSDSFLSYWYFPVGSWWVYKRLDTTADVYDTARVVKQDRGIACDCKRLGNVCRERAMLEIKHSYTFPEYLPDIKSGEVSAYFDTDLKVDWVFVPGLLGATASTHLIIVMFNLLNSNLQICLQTGQGPV